MEVTRFVISDMMALVSGLLESTLYRRKGDRGGSSIYFIRFLVFG